MSSRLPEYDIVAERHPEGHTVFAIYDEHGEDCCPTQRFPTVAHAKAERARMEREDLDNYDGPDVPGFEGGFADNH